MRNDTVSSSWPAFALVTCLAACGGESRRPGAAASTTAAAAGPPAGELAYVTNEGSRRSHRHRHLERTASSRTIPVGTRPRGIRLSQDGRTVFVALSGSPRCPPTMPDEECEKLKADKSKDGIGVIDVASRKVTKVLPGGSDPEAFDISQDGTRLFVSNEDANSATIVDIASGKILARVPVGREPEGVKLHPNGKVVWVTGETDHDITVLDAESGKVIARSRWESGPGAWSSPTTATEPM